LVGGNIYNSLQEQTENVKT